MVSEFGTWGLSWLAGSLTTLSPCVFPILPMVLGSSVQGHRWGPVAMGLGMALSFAGVGVLLGAAGDALGLDSEHVRAVGAVLLLVFGLVLWVPALSERFSRAMLPLASGAQQVSARLSGQSLASAALLGAVLGLVWSPCSGPFLASALTLAASEGGAWRGGWILGLFGLGAATPLVAVAYVSRAGFGALRERVLAQGERLKKGFGALIALLGLAILTGADKWLEALLVARLPESWLRLTTLF
mgnify:FL=1